MKEKEKKEEKDKFLKSHMNNYSHLEIRVSLLSAALQ